MGRHKKTIAALCEAIARLAKNTPRVLIESARARPLQDKGEDVARPMRRVCEPGKTANTHPKTNMGSTKSASRCSFSNPIDEEFTQDDLDYSLERAEQLEVKRNYFDYSDPQGKLELSTDCCAEDITTGDQYCSEENITDPLLINKQTSTYYNHETDCEPDQEVSPRLQEMANVNAKETDEEIDKEIDEIFLLDDDEDVSLLDEEGVEAEVDPLVELKVDDEDREFYDQIDWELLDDFVDDYEEEPERHEFDRKIQTDGRVTRKERARQVAIDVGQQYAMDNDGVDLLSEIFEIYRWNKARTAIEDLLNAGISTEELRLAHEVRIVWRAHEEFSNCLGKYPYPAMPWPLAVNYVRAFYSLPSVDEMEMTLNDIYSDWYSTSSALSTHISFYEYLRDRLHFRSQDVFASPAVWLGSGYESQDDEYFHGAGVGFDVLARQDLEDYGLIPNLGADAIMDHVAIVEINKEVQESIEKEKECKKQEEAEKVLKREPNRDIDHCDEKPPTAPDVNRGWIGNHWHDTTSS